MKMLPAASALVVLSWLCVVGTASSQPVVNTPLSPKTVLAIHWGPADFSSTPAVNDAIRDAISTYGQPVDYFAEYLESDRIPTADVSQALADYIHRKYRERRIDLVLAVADPALRFALERRQELFPGAPIVFSGVGLPDDATRTADGGVTAVMRGVAYGETVKLALDLHPDTERVFVIARSRDRQTFDSVRAELREFSRRVALTYLDQGTVPGLLAAVRTVPARSVVVYVWYAPDDPGFVPSNVSVLQQVAAASPVPVYGTNERYIGAGIVGGVMRGAAETGTRMGEMARQILDGTRAQDIPIENARLVTSVDWRQIQRWRIDPGRLPAGANTPFKTPTAWESYRPYIIGIAVVVAAQLLLIAGLLTQRARRRRAEAMTRASETTLRSSYERIRQLAGRLINAQEAARAALARDLHDDVCQRLAGVSMTVTSLKDSRGRVEDPQTQDALAKLYDETLVMAQGIRRLSHELHPATLRLLGLAVALKAHCTEVAKRHGVEVTFKAEGDPGTLNTETAVCLFRIAQESLRNAVMHGGARHLAVALVRIGEYVELTISDDGRGFDLEAVRKNGSGLGLISIEERAHVVGGDVQISTAPMQGTIVRVKCPARDQPGMMAAG